MYNNLHLEHLVHHYRSLEDDVAFEDDVVVVDVAVH